MDRAGNLAKYIFEQLGYTTVKKEQMPYLIAAGKVPKYFKTIKEATTPQKFTLDFLRNKLLLKSNNDRKLVSLLKKMKFVEENGIPTKLYNEYKNDKLSEKIMAIGIKNAYAELFDAKIEMNKEGLEQIRSYVKSITGIGGKSPIPHLIAKTFSELVKIANFSENTHEKTIKKNIEINNENNNSNISKIEERELLRLNYTISINLPVAESEVYDRIFESIKKVLLGK